MSKVLTNLEALAASPARETCVVAGQLVRPTGKLKAIRRAGMVIAEISYIDDHGRPRRGWLPEHHLQVRE